MKALRRAIPSMFHRRLLLLAALVIAAAFILWGQLFRLTVAQGLELRAEAERALVDRTLLPTERGKILDRKGRILARDKASFEVLVEYRVLTGRWAYDQARSAAYRDHREDWARLGFDGQEQLVADYLPSYQDKLDDLWATLASVGEISRTELDDRKSAIVERVQEVRAHSWGRWRRNRAAELGRPVTLDEVAEKVREETIAHTLIEALPDKAAFELQSSAEAAQWPGLRIERSRIREHLWTEFTVGLDPTTLPSPLRTQQPVSIDVRNVANNLVGSMRDAWKEDADRRPYDLPDGSVDLGGYRDGDSVGADGIEAAAEEHLRGVRGQLVMHRDNRQVQRQSATPGSDVHLTIDVALQARIMAIMDPAYGLTRVQSWHQNEDTPAGTPLFGSALVMEVDSGELLALVSTPTLDPDSESDPALDPNNPQYLKPLQAVYAPGSTIKPIMYAIAANSNKIEFDQTFSCEGHLFPNDKKVFRCWGYRPEEGDEYIHGTLGPVEAIARSCNIYFYSCGRRLGHKRLIEELHRFGMGVPTDLGLPGESPGIVKPRDLSEATMGGIGQGQIAVPPIQVAVAHATLARGGVFRAPLLIRERARQRAEHDLNLPPRVVQNVLQGMHDSANASYGTAAYIRVPDKEPIFNFPNVTLRAKTGTAQTTPQYALVRKKNQAGIDEIVADRSKILRDGDHSWYVLHVQKPGAERAAYIIVVMVEYGGSGGKVSGPIANQILYALKDEGYL